MLNVLGGRGPGEAERGMVHIKPGILRPTNLLSHSSSLFPLTIKLRRTRDT